MSHIKNRVTSWGIVLLGLLGGCASHYRGPAPDYSKRGAEQIQEIRKFELDESFMGQGLFYHMGPRGETYSLGSITPLIKEVSPEAYAITHRGQMTYAVAMLGAVALVGTAVLAESNDHRTWAWVSAGSALALASYGGISIHLANQEAARKFNKDIHKKFAPAVSYQREF